MLSAVVWTPSGVTKEERGKRGWKYCDWGFYDPSIKVIYLNAEQLDTTWKKIDTLAHEFIHYVFDILGLSKFLDEAFDGLDWRIHGYE